MASWRRGSTPTNTFSVNVDLTDATVYVSYSQNGRIVIDKTGEDLDVSIDAIVVQLSQKDTLMLKPGEVEIQIRYVMADGTADASNIIKVQSERILKDGEITYV